MDKEKIEQIVDEDDIIELIEHELCDIGMSECGLDRGSLNKLSLNDIHELAHNLYESLFMVEKNKQVITKYLKEK